ncbi:hypothetical protein Trydic_g9858 [Trypoxylus dichotomus]
MHVIRIYVVHSRSIIAVSGARSGFLNFTLYCQICRGNMLIYLVTIFVGSAFAAPGGGFVAFGGVKPPITFDGGNIGVNFAGYHASAGLGGLLGSGAAGGLHAEAGTPFGQSAGAGLGGVVAKGKSAGGLYAVADSGAGPAAGAAIGGIAAESGAIGGSVAAAKGATYITKTVEHESPVIVKETIEQAPQVQKTYIERTVIPNYVEKTVQVPSYVEKTIRVPTVVEKKITVPAPPTVIEKTINAPPETIAGGEVRKTVYHKSYTSAVGGTADAGTYSTNHYYGGGYGGGGSAVFGYRKSFNSDLVNDIFNIPISTLSAVSRLVGGIAGGASGSLSFSKQVVV